MTDWWNRPTDPAVEPEASPADAPSVCPWCGHAAGPGCNCANCGAVLAQREDLGGLVIPGVTSVDPSLQPRSYTASLVGTQTHVSTLNAVGGVGGTGAQLAFAALILAKDGLRGQGGAVATDVGKPSEAALKMAERLRQTGSPSTEAGQQVDAAPAAASPDATMQAEQPIPQSGDTPGNWDI